MAEIRKKFNIGRFTLKNILLLVLLIAATAIITVVGKLARFQINDVNVAQAQNCWAQPSCSGCSSCSGSCSASCSASCSCSSCGGSSGSCSSCGCAAMCSCSCVSSCGGQCMANCMSAI